MQILCFIQSSILTPYVWILSYDLDFAEPNFITKMPNFRSSEGPKKKCFHIRELQMRKLFNWHYVFTHIWYLEKEPKWALPKIYARCDEIMRRDEIRWFDEILSGFFHFWPFSALKKVHWPSYEMKTFFLWLGRMGYQKIRLFILISKMYIRP